MNRICILTSAHPPHDPRIFYKEARSLTKVGYDVTLIAQNERDEIVDGIKVICIPKTEKRIERMTRSVWQVYRRALEEYGDIYHFHDPELIPVGLLLKHHGKKVIYDVHEDLPRQNLAKAYIPAVWRKPLTLVIESMENFSAKRFDGVISATPFINNRFLRLGARAVNVCNFPLVSEFRTRAGEWSRKERAVCYIGGIADIRGAIQMIEAIERIDCGLLLAGNFAPGIKDRLQQMAGWRRVEVLGYLDREGVMATMRRSLAGLVLLHPIVNYLDSLPIKMFEYMLAGIPVIASDFSLWRNIIDETRCGLYCDPLNPEAIAETIHWIMDHPDDARSMGENGRRAIYEKYNWEAEGEKLIAFYRTLLN